MVVQTYSEYFWGGDLSSTHGFEVLSKRNHDGKKMCQELEDYLKKRAKLELEFSKSLNGLTKCFKHREEVGELEAALNQFKQELDSIAKSHHGASVFFTNQAEVIKAFKDEQNAKVKQVEDSMVKAQSAKLNQLSRTSQLEKTYNKKCTDRDLAQNNLKDFESSHPEGKELEKAKTKCTKADEEAQKADNNYRSAVIVLDSTTAEWEKKMELGCQAIQELDEKKVRYLRNELWVSVNVDSKLALDIDNCCESVRQKLEKCDVDEDIQAFVASASTGISRPKRYSFRHYSGARDHDADTESTTGSIGSVEDTHNDKSNSLSKQRGAVTKNLLNKFKKN